MKLNCPECKLSLDTAYKCSNGHQYYKEDGVLILLNSDTKGTLLPWLVDFEDFRSSHLHSYTFETLPESGVTIDKQLWEARIQDLTLIRNIIAQPTAKVLDIGSWNGWLANQLTKDGHQVIAIDYFVHEMDGMKAKNQYSNPNWFSIQMELNDLSVINEQFDLIVFNRCIAYLNDPLQLIIDAKKMLSPAGKIIVTGMNVTKINSEAQELTELALQFKENYGKDLVFNSSKNYLNHEDLDHMRAEGVTILAYPGIKNKLIHAWFKNKNVVYYGIYQT